MTNFVKSEIIAKSIKMNAIGGIKIPHKVSQPVLRNTKSGYALAAFVFLFNAEQLRRGEINRPQYWVLANISDGEIYKNFSCASNDFSKEHFDKLYDIKEQSVIQLNDTYYNELYSKLDIVRTQLIQNQYLDRKTYDEYITSIIKTIPQSYRIFYEELSKV